MGADQERVLRGLMDAWNRGDLDAYLAHVHPEVEWSSATMRELEGEERVYHGHDGMRQFWEEWRAVWEFVVDLQEIREVGSGIYATADVRVVAKASGAALERRVGYAVRFEDGLVRSAQSYLDPADALAALS